jgi:HD-like signal output (HDOD) protein
VAGARIPTADLLDRIDELGLNMSTAVRVQELWRREADISDVEEVIALDPVLASRLLQLANNDYYGHSRAVASLHEAIVRIGVGSTRDLAWSLSLHALGAEIPTFGPALQRHGVEVAASAKLLARYVRPIAVGDAFVAGLLHDLGKQLLVSLEPDLYVPRLKRYGIDDARLLAFERRTFGFDHASLTGRALERWNLPEHLVHGVSNHHAIRAVKRRKRDDALALPAVLHLAERLTVLRRRRIRPEAAAVLLEQDPVNRMLAIEASQIAVAAEVLDEEIAFVAGLLDVS